MTESRGFGEAAITTGEAPVPRILVFAPACNPLRGSERGVGWLWSRLIAGLGETWVLTRETNREAIEAGMAGVPEGDRLHFVYVEVPGWPRGWEPGKGGGSVYYLLWQRAALRAGRRLHREIGFDIVWHVTFANAWMGSLAPLTGPPFVYGPVGGGVGNPWRLQLGHGIRGTTYEVARAAGRAAGRYLNPIARVAWSRAGVILVQNSETRTWLPRRHRNKALVCPNPVLDESFPLADEGPNARARQRPASPMALFAGRLVAWKGMFLALRALAELPEWRLVVCGKGRDEKRLRRLAGRLGVADRVEFRGFVPRQELMRLMRHEASVLLFPSLHEEAGWVVVEALASGLPVVCVRRGGPAVLSGDGVDATSIKGTARALAERMASLTGPPEAASGHAPTSGARWTLQARRSELAAILKRSGLLKGRVARNPIGTTEPSTGASREEGW